MRMILIFALPVLAAAVILGVAATKGIGIFKKQGVAWALTLLMALAAVGIGYGKANALREPVPEPERPGALASFVRDEADVISSQARDVLDSRNRRIYEDCGAAVGVVTGNFDGDDLSIVAMKYAEELGLDGNCMIVVLDISGDSYWLSQGQNLRKAFTDEDCSDYAYGYMERDFARGNYGDAVLTLTEALEIWYGEYY